MNIRLTASTLLVVVLPAHAGPYADYVRALPALPATLVLAAGSERLDACDDGPAAVRREAADAALVAQAEAQARQFGAGVSMQAGAAVASDEARQEQLQAQAAAIAALPPAERMKAMMQLAGGVQAAVPQAAAGQTFGPIETAATQCLAALQPDLDAIRAANADLERRYAGLRQRAASARVPCPVAGEGEYSGGFPPACTEALRKQIVRPYADGSAQLVEPYWQRVRPLLTRTQGALAACLVQREQAEAEAIRAGAIRANNLAMTRFSQASLETLNRYTEQRHQACASAQPAVLASRWSDLQFASYGYVEDASGQVARPGAFALNGLP